MRKLWDRLPQPQWIVLRFAALFSAHLIASQAQQLEPAWLQGLAYGVAWLVLLWALAGLLRLGVQRWRK